jgi:hypothetical protein
MVRQAPIESGPRHAIGWLGRAVKIALLASAAYVLSSGPILATAFWLREATDWDGFYLAIWLYYPVFLMGALNPDGLVSQYIEWWVELFGTVGPG